MESLKAKRNEANGRWEIEGLEPSSETFDKICDMLKSNVNFKFARYGDGEWFCMFGKEGANCDNHKYFKDMGERLRESIQKSPDYMAGIQPLSLSHKIAPKVKEFCKGLDIDWYDADALHSASIDGRLNDFVKALDGKYIILVGPLHLSSMFSCVHIVIPDVDCWLKYKEIKEQLNYHLDEGPNSVVLFCASMMTEILISDFATYDCTMIDCGSVLDPFVGVKSRSYHHKL